MEGEKQKKGKRDQRDKIWGLLHSIDIQLATVGHETFEDGGERKTPKLWNMRF